MLNRLKTVRILRNYSTQSNKRSGARLKRERETVEREGKNYGLSVLHTLYRAFSDDVTAAILVFQNNETAAMLVYLDNPVGVELFSSANVFFCSNKFA